MLRVRISYDAGQWMAQGPNATEPLTVLDSLPKAGPSLTAAALWNDDPLRLEVQVRAVEDARQAAIAWRQLVGENGEPLYPQVIYRIADAAHRSTRSAEEVRHVACALKPDAASHPQFDSLEDGEGFFTVFRPNGRNAFSQFLTMRDVDLLFLSAHHSESRGFSFSDLEDIEWDWLFRFLRGRDLQVCVACVCGREDEWPLAAWIAKKVGIPAIGWRKEVYGSDGLDCLRQLVTYASGEGNIDLIEAFHNLCLYNTDFDAELYAPSEWQRPLRMPREVIPTVLFNRAKTFSVRKSLSVLDEVRL